MIAPDAVHAKEDYQRRDKRHSHLCVQQGIINHNYKR